MRTAHMNRQPIFLLVVLFLSAPVFGCQKSEQSHLLKTLKLFTRGPQIPEIQDILLYNGSTYIPYEACEWSGNFHRKIHHMLDGDPETVFTGQNIHTDLVLDPVPVTALVIRTENPASLENSKLDVQDFRGKSIETISLGIISTLPESAAYRFDLNTKEFTPVNEFPEITEKLHESPTEYLLGRHYTFENGIPHSLTLSAEFDYTWVLKEEQLHLTREEHRSRDAGRIELSEWLLPGKTIAVDIHLGYQDFLTKIEQTIEVGGLAFTLKDANMFQTPDGNLYFAKSDYKPGDKKYTILVSRGDHENSNAFEWAVLGRRHHSKGTYIHGEKLDEFLPLAFDLKSHFNWVWWNPDAQLLDTTKINSISVGDLQKPLGNIHMAWKDFDFDRSVYKRKVFDIRDLSDTVLPQLVLDKTYGQMSDAEFELFKKYVLVQDLPKSNVANCLSFGASHDLRGIRDVLHLRYDDELLLAMANWATSIFEYRNGGPHYAYYSIPGEMWNAHKYPLPKRYVAPMWPHFGGMYSIDGDIYVKQDITSTANGLASLMYFSEYAVSRPEIWNKEIELYSGRKVRCLNLALEYIAYVESSLEEFVIPNYIDEESYRLERPWNRYSHLIETYDLLIDCYEVLTVDLGEDYQEKRDFAQNVVYAYLEYFFDEDQNYTPDTVIVDGTAYAVADTRYAPKWRRWGNESEDLAHGNMEYGDFYYLYNKGRYRKYLNPSSLRIFANNFYHRMFRGYYESGQPIVANHYNGKGREAGIWVLSPFHVWTGIFKPVLYHEFADFLAFNEYNGGRIANYAFLLKLRLDLYKLGYKKSPSDPVFKAHISTDSNVYKAGELIEVQLSANEGLVSYSWDFNSDGAEDSDAERPDYMYEEPGIYVMSATVKNAGGKQVHAFKTVVVE